MGTTIKAMLNTDRVSKGGSYPLMIRIIHNRRKKLIYSFYRLKPEEFDTTTEKVLWNESSLYSKRSANEMNRYIRTQKAEIERLLLRLDRDFVGGFTADDIIIHIHKHKHDKYLFYYLDKEIEAKTRSGRNGAGAILTCCRNSLRRFTGNRLVTFNEITYRFVSDYIDHLRGRNVCVNTIHMYLRNLRAIYNKAHKEGLVSSKYSPFIDFRMCGTPTVKRALSKDKLREIAHLDLSNSRRMELVRDTFLFSFYTRGMSLIDIINLKNKDICDGDIYYVRNKTGQNFRVAITPPLQKLIDKYRTRSVYVFPFLDPTTPQTIYLQYRKALCWINVNLKKIGKLVGVEKPLTTYVARHSWATIAKSEGVSIAAISEGLGHTTEKTTQIYLRAFDHKIIDEINAKVIIL